jgi:hypothetical protein
MQKLIKRKGNEWFRRYAPAELAGTIGTLTCGIVTHNLLNNAVLTALAATWGENLGYYSWIIYAEYKAVSLKNKHRKKLYFFSIFKNVIIEFGPGEILDSSVIRPFVMYVCSTVIQNLALGLLVGKLVADILFYSLTISIFELRKKRF